MTPYTAPVASEKVLIGGRALVALGSSRSTLDTDYLICDAAQDAAFLHDAPANVDYLNAASAQPGGKFFAEIWKAEAGRQIATAQSLLELKAYAFVQHCLNRNFRKADEAEFDIKFLCREFNLSAVSVVKKYVSAGELSEINKVIASVRK